MADFLLENSSPETLEEVQTALIRLYRSLEVMLSSLDSKNILSITTDKTLVSSEDGSTYLDGAKLVMKDENGTVRLEMGKENGVFVFSLKNSLGRTSLTLSSSGDAVFSGDIITDEDAYVGNNIYLGSESSDPKEIMFFADAQDDSRRVRIRAVRDGGNVATLKIVADKIELSTLSGVTDGYGNRFVTTNFNPYVTIDGVDYPVHF